jgi:hypothetical protein
MTDEQCWQIIDLTGTAAGRDVRSQADLVAAQLATRPAADVVAFKRWVLTRMREANRTDVFTAVKWIAAANGCPHVSGDSWEYYRARLVGFGRRTFAAVLADPDALANCFTAFDDFCEGEALEIAPHRAFEKVTGSREYPDEMFTPNVVESFPPAAPEAEYESERLIARFPKLARKFGRPPRFEWRA